jgi:hypothetical protein
VVSAMAYRWSGPLTIALLASLAVAGAPAATASSTRCAKGRVRIGQRGNTWTIGKHAKGKTRCVRVSKPRVAKLPAIAPSPTWMGSVLLANLDGVRDVRPSRVGKPIRRVFADRLWRRVEREGVKGLGRAGSAAAGLAVASSPRAAARAADEFGQGGVHITTKSTPIAPAADELGSGFEGKATVTFDLAEMRKFAAENGKDTKSADKLINEYLPGLTSGSGQIDVRFEDFTKACPTADGKVAGRLKGKAAGSITSAQGSTLRTLSASINADAEYEAHVGDDGRWTDFDYEFRVVVELRDSTVDAASGKVVASEGTKTWRYFVAQKHQPRQGVDFDKAKTADGLDAEIARDFGGTRFNLRGPRGDRLSSLSNIRALVANGYIGIATTIAAKEYIRRAAMERAEKHWYDEEACAMLDVKPDKEMGDPGEVVPVKLRNVTAAPGGSFKAKITATGVPSLTPGSATFSPVTPLSFDLTLPSSAGSAKYTIVAIGKGGKKTAQGAVQVKAPASYTGPVSGDIPVSLAGSGASGRFAWTGNVTLTLDHVAPVGPGPNGSPYGAYAYYRPQAGTMHVTLELEDGNCTGQGGADIAVDPSAGDDSFVEQGVAEPTYFLYAAFGASEIPFTWSGGTPANPCSNDGTLPFGAGLPALATGMLQRSATAVLAGSSTNDFPGLGSVHRAWSLAPTIS